jgi:hypothetical protein
MLLAFGEPFVPIETQHCILNAIFAALCSLCLTIADQFTADRNVGCENLIKAGVYRLCPRLA